ncbi:MAG: PKD domain-containing protein [Bacteroidota bacterium]
MHPRLRLTIAFLLLTFAFVSAQNTYRNLTEFDRCDNWIRITQVDSLVNTYSTGDWVFLYQQRGAQIQTGDNANFGALVTLNGAGNYEVNQILSIVGDTIFLGFKLQHDYATGSNATQVVLQTDLSGQTIANNLEAPAFDGITGGILFLAASGPLTIDANLNASEKGFTGGTASIRESQCGTFTNANDYFYDSSNWRGAFKGSSITFPAVLNNRELGRGPNLTGGGGGNDHNTGGGGGGHWQAGGDGAQNDEPGLFNCRGNFPGLGGRGLNNTPTINETIYFGGGGGAGHGNNPNPHDGGNGGGIIILFAGSLELQAAFLSANGGNGQLVDGDGAGGGGAGGTILLLSENISGDAIIRANGGRGGDADNGNFNRCFGPGGGGAGGRVLSPITLPPGFDISAQGGQGGISINSAACPGNTNRGITGGEGQTNPSFSFTPEALTPLITEFSLVVDNFTVSIPADSLNLRNATTFDWDFGDGTTSTDSFPTHTYTAPGTYRITLNGSNACATDSSSLLVTITAPVTTINFTTPTTEYCVGDTVQLTNTSQNAFGLGWSISPATSNFSPNNTSENPFLIVTEPGTFTIELYVIDSNGDTLRQSTDIQVSTPPEYDYDISSNALTVTILAQPGIGTADNLTFTFPDGSTFTQEEVTFTFDQAGTYEVIATGSNACGSFSDTLSITVNVPLVLKLDAPVSTGCTPLATFFINQSEGEIDQVNWTIFKDIDGDFSLDFTGATVLSSSNDTIVIRFDSAGLYQVELAVSGPSGSGNTSALVQVELPPTADFTVAENGGFIQLTNLSTNATSYQWNFGDGNESTAFEPTHQYLTPDTYDINLNASNAFCGRAVSQTILVEEIVSVDDPVRGPFLSVYPNPVREWLNIDSDTATVHIYNDRGQVVIPHFTKPQGVYPVNVSDLPAGTYWVSVIFENNRRQIRKIIIP